MSAAKGDRRERQAAEIYERAGYAVERATGGGSHSPDFFGEYDLIALRPGDGTLLGDGPELRLIQVRSNGASGIEGWTGRVLPHVGGDVQPEMAVCYDRAGWRVVHPKSDGYTTAFDERERDCAMGEALAAWLSDE